MEKIQIEYFGKTLSIETGKIAKQTNASVVVRYGDTVVLVTVVGGKDNNLDADFFPLSCHFIFKYYSQGRFPGGFIKRETKPADQEALTSRIIDRSLRPLFPDNYLSETNVIATVLSYDDDASPEVAAMLGASAALHISDLPLDFPIAGVQLGYINDQFIINPNSEQKIESSINLFVSSSSDAIVMVEGEANEVSEEFMVEALNHAYESSQDLIQLQNDLRAKVGKVKLQFEERNIENTIKKEIEDFISDEIEKSLFIPEKMERAAALKSLKDEVRTKYLIEENELSKTDINSIFDSIKKNRIRNAILENNKRVDGRSNAQIRPIDCEVNLLPKAHGSGLFTRGETQALAITTLGGRTDEQIVDDYTGHYFKPFMLHYNFPSFSVGEVGRMSPPGRREIGHGKLAEKGLLKVIPDKNDFPYTIRLVSEVLESNGSSSMATVCSGTMALMDAGVPIKTPVAGIAMGLISSENNNVILSDILGDEDHIGDMDFKVIRTRQGITALQMDIKIKGLDKNLLQQAMQQAKDGCIHILDEIEKTIDKSNDSVAASAPQFKQIKIPTNKIKNVIGSGGSMIKSITADSSSKIDIEDNGTIKIFSNSKTDCDKAISLIQSITQDLEIGSTIEGSVVLISDQSIKITYGYKEGFLDKKELEQGHATLKKNQKTQFKVIGVNKFGKYIFSLT